MSEIMIGVINTVDNKNGLSIVIDGEDEPTTKKYLYLSSYVPRVGDRVLIQQISGSYVILGNLINEYDFSGVVRLATNSGNSSRLNNKNESDLSVSKATTATNSTQLNGKTESQLNVNNAGKVRSGGTGTEITLTHAYNQLTVSVGGNSFILKP